MGSQNSNAVMVSLSGVHSTGPGEFTRQIIVVFFAFVLLQFKGSKDQRRRRRRLKERSIAAEGGVKEPLTAVKNRVIQKVLPGTSAAKGSKIPITTSTSWQFTWLGIRQLICVASLVAPRRVFALLVHGCRHLHIFCSAASTVIVQAIH